MYIHLYDSYLYLFQGCQNLLSVEIGSDVLYIGLCLVTQFVGISQPTLTLGSDEHFFSKLIFLYSMYQWY